MPRPPTRRQFVAAAAGTAVAATFADTGRARQAGPEPAPRPNVLLVICDDLNDMIGPLGGHPQTRTPNMDRLAARGVTFGNAHCCGPLCGPSRVGLLSGLYPHTSGYFGHAQQQNHWRANPRLADAVTLHEHARDAGGYRLFSAGKIFHNNHEDLDALTNPDGTGGLAVWPGFDPFPYDGDEANLPWGVPHPAMPEPFGSRANWANSFGPVGPLPTGMRWMTYNGGAWDADETPLPDERCAAYAQEVLGQAHTRPFFLTIGFNRPHTPLHVPQRYFDRFPLDGVELPALLEDDLADCAAALTRKPNGPWQRLKASPDGPRRIMQAYLACVSFVDDQLGRVLDALDASPHADDTLVIFTSDHGWHVGGKERLHKKTPWEQATRIPLIVAGPAGVVSAGARVDVPVSNVDLYPTLCDLLDLPDAPNGDGQPLDGTSVASLLADPRADWDGPAGALTAVAAQAVGVNEPGDPAEQHYALRTRHHRYIRTADGGEELYDHRVDPHEHVNLAAPDRDLGGADGRTLEALRAMLDARLPAAPPVAARP